MQRLGVLTLPTVEKNLHIIDSWLPETPIFWPPNAKSWLIWKDPDAGKDRRQEEKGTTEDDMIGWHHWLDGREFEQLRELVMDREAWHAAVHGVAKSRTWLRLNWTGIPSPPLALFAVMLSKAHLTSHSKMPGSRLVITSSWLSGLWRSFFVQFYSNSIK